MRRIAGAAVIAAAMLCSRPSSGQQLTVGDVRVFIAKIEAAAATCDIDTVSDHIAELAVVTLTGNVNGSMRVLRLNKSKYREFMAIACQAESRQAVRSNEKITINGDQALVTADVAETAVIRGRQITTVVREKATVESLDGRLMLTQLVANEIQ